MLGVSLVFFSWLLSPPRQPRPHRPLPGLNPDGHLHLPEGVLAHEIGVPLITALHHRVRVRHARIGEQQELGPCEGLEDREAEERALEALDAGVGEGGVGIGPGGGVGGAWSGEFGGQGAGDGVDAVEGAGEDEVVVCGKSGGAGEAEGAGRGGLGGGVGGGGGLGGEGAVVD